MLKQVSKIPQPGDKGDNVAVLQSALNEHGNNLSVDGVFGPKTKSATSHYQKSIGLPGSGVPGEKTMAGLGIEISASAGGRPTSGIDLDEGTPPWYRRMFAALVVSPTSKESQVSSEMNLIDRGLSRYLEVSKRLGFSGDYQMMFAYILGCLHYKEAGCSFAGVLHNGEHIIGTGKKTTLVPAGRGPFSNWEDAAVDAINLNGARWSKLRAGETDIGEILYAIERYNGAGYINGAGKLEVTPYLWENSNISDGYGKYVSDGHYDPKAKLGPSSGIAVFLKKWFEAGDFKCTGVEKAAPSIPLPDLSPKPVGQLTRQVIADKIVSIIQRDVDAELRETGGKNRSPRIDSFNKRVHAPMGCPYCASGGWCAIDDACKALGLKNPVKPTAASQDFRRTGFIPAKYLRPEGSLGKKGDVGVLQVPGDSGHGHHTTLREDQTAQPYFKTVEYNTDGSGTRDGDGAYQMTRSTTDRSSSNAGKIFVCFTDIPQYILDFNS
jgi:lysozyme family protein